MMRDANTPLILWICAAVCAHLMFGEGGDVVAQYHDDRRAIAALGEHVRERVRFSERTFEVGTAEPNDKVAQNEVKPPEPPPAPKPTAKPVTIVTPPKPEAKKAAPPPPAPKKVAVKLVPEDPAHKLMEPLPQKSDRRIAVRQHVQPNQADNP